MDISASSESEVNTDRTSTPRINSYTTDDAVNFLRRIKHKGVRGIVTSPPYNKAFNGRGRKPGSNWKNSKLMADNYSHFEDNLPEKEYVAWQREVLHAAMECIDDEGVILYNMGRKLKDGGENQRECIVNGFPVRQVVIWNRGSTHNHGGKRPTRLPAIYELIYVIAGKNWKLPEKYLAEFRHWGDVWRITPEMRNPHPAPFPLALAVRMTKLVDGLVADPFAGSGTVGLAAMELDLPYLLNDISPEYRTMFNQRKREHQKSLWNH